MGKWVSLSPSEKAASHKFYGLAIKATGMAFATGEPIKKVKFRKSQRDSQISKGIQWKTSLIKI